MGKISFPLSLKKLILFGDILENCTSNLCKWNCRPAKEGGVKVTKEELGGDK